MDTNQWEWMAPLEWTLTIHSKLKIKPEIYHTFNLIYVQLGDKQDVRKN